MSVMTHKLEGSTLQTVEVSVTTDTFDTEVKSSFKCAFLDKCATCRKIEGCHEDGKFLCYNRELFPRNDEEETTFNTMAPYETNVSRVSDSAPKDVFELEFYRATRGKTYDLISMRQGEDELDAMVRELMRERRCTSYRRDYGPSHDVKEWPEGLRDRAWRLKRRDDRRHDANWGDWVSKLLTSRWPKMLKYRYWSRKSDRICCIKAKKTEATEYQKALLAESIADLVPNNHMRTILDRVGGPVSKMVGVAALAKASRKKIVWRVDKEYQKEAHVRACDAYADRILSKHGAHHLTEIGRMVNREVENLVLSNHGQNLMSEFCRDRAMPLNHIKGKLASGPVIAERIRLSGEDDGE